MDKRISLVEIKGDPSIYIDVEITDEGDLQFSGQDIGASVKKMFGDSDYEYWLTIKAEHKDQLLLALIEKFFTGNATVISEVKELLEKKKIPCKFFSYA